jgi:hypothetical protein
MVIRRRRRFLWHAVTGFWVGFACTILLAPCFPDEGAAVPVVLARVVCTPLLAMLVGLMSAFFSRSAPIALVVTCVCALFAGVVDDVAIRALAHALDGAAHWHDLHLGLLFSLGNLTLTSGALVGAVSVVPLCAATWAARSAAESPRGTRGVARNVILVAGATASVGVPFVRIGLGSTPLWPVVTVGCAVGALACLVQASCDLGVVVFLGKLLRREDPRLAVARSASLPGVDAVSSLSDDPTTGHVVLWRLRQYDGPGRISQDTTPVLQLGAAPSVVKRSLFRSAVILLLLAGTQFAMAIGAAGLSFPR